MIGNKKVFLPALAFIMAGCVAVPSAFAADDLVLFKIHDVTPVKNDDGLVTSCSFGATFYNRSPYTLKSVRLNLSWEDESIANSIAREKNENVRKNNRKSSETENRTSTVVSTAVNLYNLAPKTQKTLRAKVDSDRCFLLLNDVQYDASDCSITAAEGTENPYMGNEKCTSFFEFVSTENPEYYREFKAISYSEEKANDSAGRSKDRSEINRLYDETMEEFNNVKTALSGIKGDVDPNDIAAAQNVPDSSASNKDDLKSKIDALFPSDAASSSSAKGNNNASGGNTAATGTKNPFDGAASVNSAAEAEAGKNFAAGAVDNNSSSDSTPVWGNENVDNSISSSNSPSNGVSINGGGNGYNPDGVGTSGDNNTSSSENTGGDGQGSSSSAWSGGANSSSPADNVNFGPTDNVSGIIGNGVFNDDVDISYENVGYEGKTYERPSSNEKPYVTTKDKMIYNSPNAI